MELYQYAIAGGVLVLSMVASAAGAAWAVRGVTAGLNEKIDKVDRDLRQELAETRETVTHQFGETISALKAKINDMELWNRDNFMGKKDFAMIWHTLTESFRRFEDKIDQRFDKLDLKFDKTVEVAKESAREAAKAEARAALEAAGH